MIGSRDFKCVRLHALHFIVSHSTHQVVVP
jgi:hypothetical protein